MPGVGPVGAGGTEGLGPIEGRGPVIKAELQQSFTRVIGNLTSLGAGKLSDDQIEPLARELADNTQDLQTVVSKMPDDTLKQTADAALESTLNLSVTNPETGQQATLLGVIQREKGSPPAPLFAKLLNESPANLQQPLAGLQSALQTITEFSIIS